MVCPRNSKHWLRSEGMHLSRRHLATRNLHNSMLASMGFPLLE